MFVHFATRPLTSAGGIECARNLTDRGYILVPIICIFDVPWDIFGFLKGRMSAELTTHNESQLPEGRALFFFAVLCLLSYSKSILP